MNNPEAIRFANEVVRPLCEEARGLEVRLGALATSWNGGLSAVFGADTNAAVEDGRDAEGVSRLTCFNVIQAVEQLLGVTLNAEIIQKPCVRVLP